MPASIIAGIADPIAVGMNTLPGSSSLKFTPPERVGSQLALRRCPGDKGALRACWPCRHYHKWRRGQDLGCTSPGGSIMNSRSRSLLRLIGLPLVMVCGYVQSESWTGTLHDGSVIRVDPDTHRAMRHYGGGVAPLWDGTHRMEDGSVVIIRQGEAVPTESMIDAWRTGVVPSTEFEHRYCDQLVRKVCGFHQECAVDQSCVLAQQLLRMETEERRRAPIASGSRPETDVTLRCQESLSDEDAFPVCGKARPNAKQTACRQLVERVCGAANQCGKSPACDPARQLLAMELSERLASADPDKATPTGVQCEEAENNEFFAACQR